MRFVLSTALACIASVGAALAEPATFGPRLEGFDYGYPVQTHTFESQHQTLEMAYLDLQPDQANGRAVVLLHGKNFCAGTWTATIDALLAAGYRVIAPDQIGFCKSSKPQHYQFSFHQLAHNTHQLLTAIGTRPVIVMGHSMGGMLAMRYGLMYPEQVEQLVLVNPIGLEDWKALGVPYADVDTLYQQELQTTADSLREYQRNTYYAGEWRPAYERWVEMLAGMYLGSGREQVAWNQALTSDMIFTQPVVRELEQIAVPTVLLIGEHDNTAIGKQRASPSLRERLGDYSVLGEQAAARIPDATLVEFPDLGHSPHIQAPEHFHAVLLEQLASESREHR